MKGVDPDALEEEEENEGEDGDADAEEGEFLQRNRGIRLHEISPLFACGGMYNMCSLGFTKNRPYTFFITCTEVSNFVLTGVLNI